MGTPCHIWQGVFCCIIWGMSSVIWRNADRAVLISGASKEKRDCAAEMKKDKTGKAGKKTVHCYHL